MFGRGQSKALQGALLVDRINTLAEDTRLANGFVEKDIGSFSINGRVLTYKFTAEERPQIYAGGHKYTPLSGSYSVTLPATADRGYYVYFNVEDNSLEYQAGYPEVTNKRVLLAWAYVGLNSQIIWYARETHGAGRNLDWHEAQHKNVGAIWRSGGNLDVAPNRVVTIATPIVIADEDLVQVIGAGQELNQNLTMVDLPTLYWKGSAWDISTSFFMESFWDNRQTSSLARVPNGKFSAAFILFTDNIAHPVVRVYANDYYDSADEAREASVDLIGLPMPELVPAWKVVMDSSNVVRYIDKIVSRVGGLVEMGVGGGAGGGVSDHDDLLGKDKENQHPISSITNLQTNLNNKLTRSSNLSDLTNTTTARNNLGLKGLATMNPSDLSFAASSHTHTLSSLSGTLPVNRGGTGATTVAAARTALGLGDLATRNLSSLNFASSSHNHSIDSLTGTLALSKGGTGATTAAQARTNLGLNNLGDLASLSDVYGARKENETPAVATGSFSLALGYSARASGAVSVAMGRSAVASGSEALALGRSASAGGTYSIAIGYNTKTPASHSIAIGWNAAVLSDHHDSVALGPRTNTNAPKQIQIGAASGNTMPSTVHTAVAITTRSDERDKTDIRDTELGLEFINKLRPVQWRWDYRGDYLPEEPEDFHEWEKDAQKEWKERHNIQNVKPEDKDGSKKRTRFHNGFIAQDVKQAMDELGVDFAGYQDASVQGCSDGDVRGLVYEQFIAPMVKAIQEQQEIIDNLTTRLSKLEGGK